jgi:transporter family protein
MDYMKYAFVALVGWGFWAIGSKIMTRYFNTASTSFWISLASIFFLSLFVVTRGNLMVRTHALIAIPIGLVSTIAMLALYYALKHGPASVVMPIANMYIVFPVVFGFIFLQEAITLPRVLGIICAILATIFLSL